MVPANGAVSRVNAVCPYFTMFPLSFPLDVLSQAAAGDWVLDPFCGRGTTLFAARLLGLSAVGIDVNPVAVALAQAKLVATTPDKVVRACQRLLDEVPDAPIPDDEFWGWAFHPTTLGAICRLRNGLAAVPSTPEAIMLRALLLGVLHGPLTKRRPSYLSNQMPRTYATKPAAAVRYWRARDLRPGPVDALDLVRRRAQYVLAEQPRCSPGQVVQDDAAAALGLVRRRFRWIVTSPPYYGMRTYAADQWLRMWFLGAPPHVDYGSEEQLGQRSQDAFVDALAAVWRRAAERCHPGAHLIVRIGALPSKHSDPAHLLTESLKRADAGWSSPSLRSAGAPRRQRRQAEQFVSAGNYADEVDATARLG